MCDEKSGTALAVPAVPGMPPLPNFTPLLKIPIK